MAVHVEAKIVDALMEHFGGITLPDGVDVAYPNVDFTPDGSAYVRLNLQRNGSFDAPHIGGDGGSKRQGIFQATVAWPVGKGPIAPSEVAGEIRDRFAFNTKIAAGDGWIWVVDEPAIEDGETGPVYHETHVLVPYRFYP